MVPRSCSGVGGNVRQQSPPVTPLGLVQTPSWLGGGSGTSPWASASAARLPLAARGKLTPSAQARAVVPPAAARQGQSSLRSTSPPAAPSPMLKPTAKARDLGAVPTPLRAGRGSVELRAVGSGTADCVSKEQAPAQLRRCAEPAVLPAAVAIGGRGSVTRALEERQLSSAGKCPAQSGKPRQRQDTRRSSDRLTGAEVFDTSAAQSGVDGPSQASSSAFSWSTVSAHRMVLDEEKAFVASSLDELGVAVTQKGGLKQYAQTSFGEDGTVVYMEALPLSELLRIGVETSLQRNSRTGGDTVVVLLGSTQTMGMKKEMKVQFVCEDLEAEQLLSVCWDWQVKLERQPLSDESVGE